MERIAVIGLGLMGASIGLALKERRAACGLTGYARREETCQEAVRRGMVDDATTDLVEAVRDADLVVYCTPILTIPDLARQSLPGLKSGAILTDVGSTKSYLARALDTLLAGSSVHFVGSHPIAGSEQQGLEAARADLYQGAMTVLTPLASNTDASTVIKLKQFWEALGSRVSVMSPERHDQIMARTSHLPHMIASLLADTVGRDTPDPATAGGIGEYCGTGLRDTSRVAEGSPDVWHDIVLSNADALLSELSAYHDAVRDLMDALEKRDFKRVRALLERGRSARRRLLSGSPLGGDSL